MTYIAVKNFERYQHYKDRNPKWIKLYNELLDDYAFLALSEPMQRHLLMIWLIASRHDNRIPNDPTYLARAIHAKGRVDFAPLFDAGFLIYTEHPASVLLAEPEHPASKNGAKPERPAIASRARESKRESKSKRKNKGADADASPFPKGVCDALYEVWVSEIGAVEYPRFRKALSPLYPTSGPRYTQDQLANAIKAFNESRLNTTSDKRSFWNPEKFAGDVVEQVRIGAMRCVDDDGIPTERGRIVMSAP